MYVVLELLKIEETKNAFGKHNRTSKNFKIQWTVFPTNQIRPEF